MASKIQFRSTGSSLYISMEYAELGDMQSLINDQK